MTACVNKKSKRVAAVVTASLVGALSIGAPAVALAANNIDFQVAPAEDAFSRGSITLTGVDGNGTAATPYTKKANGDGSALNVKATQVTPLGADSSVAINDTDFEVVFSKADGTVVKEIVEPGNYVVTVKALKGVYAGSSVSTKLVVTAAKLNDVSYFDANSTLEDKTADDKFVFTGSKHSIGFASASAKIVEGVDYEVKVLKKGTDNVSSAAGVEILEAGDYVAYLTGMGQYAGEIAEVPFTVEEFDFSSASFDEIDLFSSDSAPVHPTRVYVKTDADADYAELDPSLVDLTFASGPAIEGGNTGLFDKTGKYTFTPSYKDTKNIKGETTKVVTVNKIGKVAEFKFDGAAVKDSYLIDLSKEGQSVVSGGKFNWDAIAVYNGDTKLAKGTNYSVTVADADGVPGKYADLENLVPGTYKVTVRVIPGSVNHEVGGSVTFTVKVVENVVDADANVFVYLKSSKEAVNSISKIYDGVAIEADHYEAKAFDADGKQITDDTLKVELRDADGKAVRTVSDAGEYTLVVVSEKLELTGDTVIPVTIEKADLSTLKVNSLTDHFGAPYLPLNAAGYSYSELDLRFDTHVADSDENDKAADKEGWDALTHGTWGSKTKFEMFDEAKGEWVSVHPGKAEGVVRVTLSGDEKDAVNYKFANDDNTTVVEFLVIDADKLVFNDVKPGDWFFDVVFDAQDNGWMNGYADGVLFGAHDRITRGQVACVLFNMAGEDMNENDSSYNEVFGWKSFSDVNGKAYYGEAIAWAKQAGVVNGYGDGTFAPDAPVTREELACMLANYAKKVDQADVSVEDADEVLSSVSDGASVSGWAKGSVAWAVENEIMGNGGFVNALSDITRAETAAMVVNYMA